jgi:hypothetical protein
MSTRYKPAARKGRNPGRRHQLSTARLEAMIEEATVDAYGESEQRAGFYTMMEDGLALPFETQVLGVEVTVERIDLTSADEIVAICTRGRSHQAIPILELPLPLPLPVGAEWIEAYRRWARGE